MVNRDRLRSYRNRPSLKLTHIYLFMNQWRQFAWVVFSLHQVCECGVCGCTRTMYTARGFNGCGVYRTVPTLGQRSIVVAVLVVYQNGTCSTYPIFGYHQIPTPPQPVHNSQNSQNSKYLIVNILLLIISI